MPEEQNKVSKDATPVKEKPAEKKSKPKKNLLVIVITAIVTALVLVTVGVGVYIYYSGYRVAWVNAIARVVPYPMAIVDGNLVRLSDFTINMQIAQHNVLAQKQVDIFDPANKQYREMVEQGVLASQVEGIVIDRLDAKYKIAVTSDDIKKEEDTLIKQFKDRADFEKTVKDLFGCDVATFESHILHNQIAKQKLQKYYLDNKELTKTERDKAAEVLTKIQKGGDFAALAKQYSDDSSASQGGDLGTAALGTYDPDFEKAALALEPGKVSGIVQTQFGWHIIQLVAKDSKSLHAKHILVQSKFEDWLVAAVKGANIQIMTSAFTWDKTLGQLNIAHPTPASTTTTPSTTQDNSTSTNTTTK
jgi:parvulin-like peptidyl-prolyl isomerase